MDISLKPHKKPSKGVLYGFEINDNNRKFIKIGKSKDLKKSKSLLNFFNL
jgi:hypothetical protein